MPSGEETLPGGIRVFTDETHRVGTDALLLAQFCALAPGDSLCDLGSGCGVILLAACDRVPLSRAVGIEFSASGAALLRRAIRENRLEYAEGIEGDLRGYKTGRPFHHVVANPPYFTQGQTSPNAARAAARHEGGATLDDFCTAAARLLRDGGRFSLCYPANRLALLLRTLDRNTLAPKRLQLVRKAPEAEPWLALVEARKFGGEGLSILPERLLPPGQPVQY